MIEIQISIPKAELDRLGVISKDARKALNNAMWRLGGSARDALKREARDVFHLRNHWVQAGMRFRKSGLTVQVGSVDRYMERHVVALTKQPGKALSVGEERDARGRLASGGLFIGTYSSASSIKTHAQMRREMSRGKTFQIVSKGGTILVMRRTGKGKRGALDLLGVLKPQAAGDTLLPLLDVVTGVVQARFGPLLSAELDYTLGNPAAGLRPVSAEG